MGALAGVLGTLVSALVLVAEELALHPLSALGSLGLTVFALLPVAVVGAFCGAVGWWIARRSQRPPWQRWDREDD